MSARAGGSPAKRKDFDENWNLINRGLWMAIAGTPMKIYRVQGKWIRGWRRMDGKYVQIYQDFTEGGNSQAYLWMKPDTIIVDRDTAPEEQKATLIHEMEEFLDMAENKHAYETAHSDAANPMEDRYRRNPGDFKEIWAGLVKRLKAYYASKENS